MVIGSMPPPLRATRMPVLVSSTTVAGLCQRVQRRSQEVRRARPRASRRRRPPPPPWRKCRSRCDRAARCGRRLRAGRGLGCAASRCRCLRSLAPILTRQSATSPISGSRAAFSITVSPLASARRQKDVVGRADRDLREIRCGRRAGQPCGALRENVAAVDIDFGAQRLQTHQVQVDRPRADGAAAGQRNLGLAACGRSAGQAPRSWRASG